MTNISLTAEETAAPVGTGETRYMDTVAAAAYLGLSRQTLERWRLDMRGPTYIKVGRAVRYSLRDLDAFMAGNRRVAAGGLSDG